MTVVVTRRHLLEHLAQLLNGGAVGWEKRGEKEKKKKRDENRTGAVYSRKEGVPA